MNKNLTAIDISNIPDLIHIAEEVKTTKQPRILTVHGETIALVLPVGTAAKPKKRREKTKADYEAFKSAAGGWRGLVDTEKLKKDMYESRRLSTRPPVAL